MKQKSLKITNRSVLLITKLCNARCKFCYYRFENTRKHKHLPFENIIKILKKYKKVYGIEYVDLSGGEPTIHPQIIDIVKICKKIGIKPTIITNAQKPNTILKLIDNGLEDILISLQGYKKHHDTIVGVPGAYEKLITTLRILNKRGFAFRINTVLSKYSCKKTKDLIKVYLRYKPRIVNLISFNPYDNSLWKDKTDLDFQVDYETQVNTAKEIIDALDKNNIWVNVRYIPFCFMKNYEKHVCNFLQLPYDPYEWENASYNDLSRTEIAEYTDEAVKSKLYGKSKKEKFYQKRMRIIIDANERVEECKNCALDGICDHIYSQYLKEFGPEYYKAVKGKTIANPMHFRKQSRRWEKLKHTKP